MFYGQMSMVDIPKTEPLREATPKGDPGGKLQALDWAHPDFLEDLLDMTNSASSHKRAPSGAASVAIPIAAY